jgi:hypothetical protein
MATPSPALHLLALPREIRDRIYSFLTHEVVLRDAGEIIVSETHEPETPSYHDPDAVLLNAIRTTITLENAPHLDIMLVNSQVHHEYRETCLQELSARVRCEGTYRVFKRSRAVNPLPPKLNNNSILVLVRTVTIWLYGKTYASEQELVMEPFLDAFAAKTPSLHTLRLINIRDDAGYDGPHVISFDNVLPYLPDLFPLMSRKQNVIGKKYESIAGLADFRAMVYGVRRRPSELWTRESVASYWSPLEENCAIAASLPLSTLRERGCTPDGSGIYVCEWVEERCSDCRS